MPAMFKRLMLAAEAIWELARFDILVRFAGFRAVGARMQIDRRVNPVATPESAVYDAVSVATALYWKRVRCLQLAVMTARLLKRHCAGRVEVVIGYRLKPLMGHAWVEVDGRPVNGSAGYQKALHVLARI